MVTLPSSHTHVYIITVCSVLLLLPHYVVSQYHGEQYPVCPFCNTTVCEVLETGCNPLTTDNLIACEHYVNSHCAGAGRDTEHACACCNYTDDTSVKCFDADIRCGEGVNNWFCKSNTTACGNIPDSCDLRTYGPYHLREIHEVSNRDLMNRWTVRHGTDIINGNYRSANLSPSFWQDDLFTHVQGTLNVGEAAGIFVLPVGFRPSRNTSFICNTAPDDIHNVTLPVLVTVLIDGMVFVDSNDTFHAITTLALKMMFTHNDTHRPIWNSLMLYLSDDVESQSEPSYYKDALTGWVHLRGHLQRTCRGADAVCMVMNALTHTDILPSTMWEGQSYVQLLDTAGQGRALNVTRQGTMLVTGSDGNDVVDIYLDGIILMEEDVTNYNLDDVDVSVSAIETSSLFPLLAATQSQRIRTDLVQLGGVLVPHNYSFHGAFIGTLPLTSRPTYRFKNLVPCRIAPYIMTCAVMVETDGTILVRTPLSNPPYPFTPEDSGHWLSLSGVRFGGYVYNVQVHLQGTSEIELTGSSYIQIGV